MANQRQMRTLIYKRTHENDPDPQKGVFGNERCMGRVRSWEFDAVIGVGGIRPWAECKGIARKLTWIGIGAHKAKMGKDGHPLVTFDHFRHYGEEGPLLTKVAPALASHMYDKGARVLMKLSEEERVEVEKILDLARSEPSSDQLKGVSQRDTQKTDGKCRSRSCRGTSAGRKAGVNGALSKRSIRSA